MGSLLGDRTFPTLDLVLLRACSSPAAKPGLLKMPGHVSGLRSLMWTPTSNTQFVFQAKAPSQEWARCHSGWREGLSGLSHSTRTLASSQCLSHEPRGCQSAGSGSRGSAGGSLEHTQAHSKVLSFSQCLRFSLKTECFPKEN